MRNFTSLHQESILGVLSMFDRLIIKGHLLSFYPKGAFKRYLWRQDVLLVGFKTYVKQATARLRAHLEKEAADSDRPSIYLDSPMTHSSEKSKEDLALEIAEKDGITEGLVCVLKVLENCRTFDIKKDETGKLDAVSVSGKCLHYYFYYIDPEFGWMHVRIQTWFPFGIQVYINGREWLSRHLDKAGITYERYGNCFLRISDLERAQKICDRLVKKSKMVRKLQGLASRLNPWLPTIRRSGFRGYYWVVDQCEYATDIMFRDRASLEAIFPDLVEHSILHFSAEDVMGFLGRKLHGNFLGEVTTDLKKRRQGFRVKHRMKANSIKMYDKFSVLRVETTINNPREFKVLKVKQTEDGPKRRWVPMAKRVANLWRYAGVSMNANKRYLKALALVKAKDKVVKELDDLCRGRIVDGRRYAKFNPVARRDADVFRAVMSGDYVINGLRNRDLAQRLFPGQELAPPWVRQAPSGQVSAPNSPSRGIVWKVQRTSPVWRSNART